MMGEGYTVRRLWITELQDYEFWIMNFEFLFLRRQNNNITPQMIKVYSDHNSAVFQ